MLSKEYSEIKSAIKASPLEDGMTVSFHHHLRNGDFVLNMVMAAISDLGYKDLTVNASALFACHEPLLDHIKQGVVSGLECNYMDAVLGQEISRGLLDKPVVFRSHGGRPADLYRGDAHIDVAFIGASNADAAGNCNGLSGKSAFGSIGYAMADAALADYVIVVSDQKSAYPLQHSSIDESLIDAVVFVDSIGDPEKIVSGTTRVTRDPIGLLMADSAIDAIAASGLLRDGLSFQTGAGGASLAVAQALSERMLTAGIEGSFASGGITGMLVDMLNAGLFKKLLDVQCFDRAAVESIAQDDRHIEISARRYASPEAKSNVARHLDVVILGATEVDLTFNVNVHTDSNGVIMGGSGGHSDTAAEARLSMIIAPLFRARLPLIVDRVGCISTPGKDIDVLLTQYGIAVNPRREDLRKRFHAGGLPLFEIEELKAKAEEICGRPQPIKRKDRTIAIVRSRYGEILDRIYELAD